MKTNYFDILDSVKEEPYWWDENGVPRFVEFKPEHMANIYANKVKLVRICCQHCKREYDVCMSLSRLDSPHRFDANIYGDPPNIGCCPGGPSSSSISIKILQYWEFDTGKNWIKKISKEIDLKCDADWLNW